MSGSSKEQKIVNGWVLYAHSMFIDQYEKLIDEVEKLQQKNPVTYKQSNITKRLAAVQYLIFEKIPKDPSLCEYRLGNTLGSEHKHWFRAKFFQQYRLFFRYHRESRVIIYAWVNDENSKRAYDSHADAYQTFKKMLSRNRPPTDWNKLLAEVRNSKSSLLSRSK
ncbi:MAG TPA: type II toxin-antitoxin system YhaV family toxin [Gammaproteobacteria bacterium]|jgi:toxin YhaV|nr:type II toxin-antitoxin system YhaV family toxin [Gammaproteobacteria bacterium]